MFLDLKKVVVMKLVSLFYACFFAASLLAQNSTVSKVWNSDLGNGFYQNPIIHADYSDPDVIRVGADYYLIASSFNCAPAIPILHSKDLVNWTIIGHALDRQIPLNQFSSVQHGNGVWAPSIKWHNGEFYLFYPDPDFGIYLTKSKNITGPWSDPILIKAGKGFIDPTVLWDDDGQVYLVHAWAGSRAGIKSILTINRLSTDASKVLDAGVIVYDGHEKDPTIEGPKIYKRNKFYYLFAPAGGVSTGWQTVLRSKNIYGPYERKVVMDQGTTTINGPHQGAWINTITGEDWFIHFQDKGAYGRVSHLQPMKWINDWPVIGIDKDQDGKGEPVLNFKKPNVGKTWPITSPADSDEFNDLQIGKQWQWQANPEPIWSFVNPFAGTLRLYTVKLPDSAKSLWNASNLLLQKFPAEKFIVNTKLSFHPQNKILNEKVGLVIMGTSYAELSLVSTKNGINLVYSICLDAEKGGAVVEKIIQQNVASTIYLSAKISTGAKAAFSYSIDGINYIDIKENFQAVAGKWIGAKIGLFAIRNTQINDSGYADFDWFRFEQLQQ